MNSKTWRETCKDTCYIDANKEQWKSLLQADRQLIRDIKKEKPDKVSKCVEMALELGCHVGFAQYFFQYAEPGSEKVKMRIWELLDHRLPFPTLHKDEKKKAEQQWDHLPVVHDYYWVSPDYEMEKELSQLEVYTCKTATMRNMRSDGNVPGREELIQVGILLGLKAEDVDNLLMSAGLERLYPLTISDAVALYYLDRMAFVPALASLDYRKEVVEEALRSLEGEGEDFTAGGLTFTERLCIVKRKINILTRRAMEADPDGVLVQYMKRAVIREKGKGSAKKTEERYPLGRYASHAPLSDQILERIREQMEMAADSPVPVLAEEEMESETCFMTLFAAKALQAEKGLDSIFENVPSEYMNKGYYGFIKKTVDYMADFSFEKNLRYSSTGLTKEDLPVFEEGEHLSGFSDGNYLSENARKGLQRLTQWTDREKINSGFNQDEDNSRQEEAKQKIFEQKMQLLNEIWMEPNALDPMSREDFASRPLKFFKAKNLIDGRQKGESLPEHEGETGEEPYGKAFETDFVNKNNVLKFLIAIGKEDEIPYMMKLAGYWPVNYYEEMQIDNPAVNGCRDRTDCLVTYALAYRDRLIEYWTAGRNEGNRTNAMNKLREGFPFLKLVTQIAQDIQLYAALEKKYTGTWEQEKRKPKEKAEMNKLTADLLFPVKEFCYIPPRKAAEAD